MLQYSRIEPETNMTSSTSVEQESLMGLRIQYTSLKTLHECKIFDIALVWKLESKAICNSAFVELFELQNTQTDNTVSPNGFPVYVKALLIIREVREWTLYGKQARTWKDQRGK